MAATSPPLDPRTDLELVAAAKAGDCDARDVLFARLEGVVYKFGLRLCRDSEDAREVLQDTLLAAARTLPTFRGESAVGTWLFSIARSFCIKRRRRRGRDASTGSLTAPGDTDDGEALDVADGSAAPDEVAMNAQLAHALERAIEALAPTNREVLLLRDVEGLTAPEVAEALGIRVEAVKSRLHRARLSVRSALAPLLGFAEAPPPPEGCECPDILLMFSRKLEGEVDQNICAEVEKHVAGCARCSAQCDSLRRTLSICHASRGATVPPRVQAEVRRAVQGLVE